MNDASLDRVLASAGERLRRLPVPPLQLTADCLSRDRGRALALNAERAFAAEQEHVAACRRCEGMVEIFARTLPHLSVWTLVRRRLGVLSAAEQRAVQYHLEEGACRRCQEREERVAATLPNTMRLAGPLQLANPAAVGALTGGLAEATRSAEGNLEVELVEEGPKVTLEVRTRSSLWDRQLIGYTLRGGGDDAESGFLVLTPDVEGWYAASAIFDATSLYRRLDGICQEVLVGPVKVDVLNDEERVALQERAEAERREAWAGAAWEAWTAILDQNRPN